MQLRFFILQKDGESEKMESFEKNWYVLHTYSGYENKVKANLESRAQSMGMGDYIFRVVVPEEVETEEKRQNQRNRS